MNALLTNPRQEPGPISILVVDDEAAIRRNFRSCLEDLGYAVVEAETGEAAMRVFAQARPAVVLTDLRMPGMGGLDLLRSLRDASPDTPVIVVSGTGTVQDAVAAMRLGAWDYLIKPLQDAAELEGVVHRVMERKRLLEENRRYRESLEQLVHERTRELKKLFLAIEQSPVSVMITDPEGRVEYVNRAFVRTTGYSPEEAIGQDAHLLRSGQHVTNEDGRQLWETIVGGGEWNGEFRNQRKNGELYWERAIISPLKDNQGAITHLLAQTQDITAQKETEAENQALQAQLIQAQKMEAVGQLAGGVAHDFNNILSVIMMNLELLRQDAVLDEPSQATLGELTTQTRRAASLTRQLLMFSRRSTPDIRVLDLNELITNLLKMLRRLIGENIELEFHHPSTVSLVEADSSMLEQVLMNLTVNARDAMPKGGRITLATEMVEVAASQSRRNPDARPGRFFCLSVADTGCGMNEATLNRVFEPFFTTKEAGKGTGLGLATVHGIVKQHRGWIEVESAVGKGTTFRVWLPPATREEEPTSGEGVRALPKGGRETILVVEDDPSVRQVAAVYLRRGGYAVLEADKPSEALRQWEQHGKKVALLLTDVVLPEGMTGMELAEKLRAEQPNLKIILSSGYATELVGRDWRTAKDVTYLPKPWVPARLAEVVREVLDREP